jgi:NAD dependent epimerase/dehydratase
MANFWHDKQVLVTGAGGFIGSHLVERLAREGALVRAFVRYNSRGDHGLLTHLPPGIYRELDIIPGDLRDLPAMVSAMQDIDTVFHLGALIAIPYSYIHPVEVVESNILGTLNILLAGRETRVRRIVHTSTSEVYGTARHVPINEDHPLQGQSPYSASKIGADKLAESFFCAFDLPVVTLRPFNTYGPRQSARAVIPSIISQALTQDVLHLGSLDVRRDFTYVTDTVEGFLCAGEAYGIEGGIFNLGTGVEISIRDLVGEIMAILGRQLNIRQDPSRMRPDRSEVRRLLSDNSWAKERLGWFPKVSLREGLTECVIWISNNKEFYRPQNYQL